MGQNAHHPIRQRLTEALRSAQAAPVEPPDYPSLPDDAALRDWVLRHHARYGLDPVWILTGHGKSPATAPPPDTRLVPVFAMSPIDPQSGRWRPLALERIALAAAIVTPGRFVVRLEDRFMEPRLRCGAYLVVDTTQTRITEGAPGRPDLARVFAVDVPGEGLTARFAHHDPETDRLVLTALAPHVPPLVMPWSVGDSRLVGRVAWVAQTL